MKGEIRRHGHHSIMQVYIPHCDCQRPPLLEWAFLSTSFRAWLWTLQWSRKRAYNQTWKPREIWVSVPALGRMQQTLWHPNSVVTHLQAAFHLHLYRFVRITTRMDHVTKNTIHYRTSYKFPSIESTGIHYNQFVLIHNCIEYLMWCCLSQCCHLCHKASLRQNQSISYLCNLATMCAIALAFKYIDVVNGGSNSGWNMEIDPIQSFFLCKIPINSRPILTNSTSLERRRNPLHKTFHS